MTRCFWLFGFGHVYARVGELCREAKAISYVLLARETRRDHVIIVSKNRETGKANFFLATGKRINTDAIHTQRAAPLQARYFGRRCTNMFFMFHFRERTISDNHTNPRATPLLLEDTAGIYIRKAVYACISCKPDRVRILIPRCSAEDVQKAK